MHGLAGQSGIDGLDSNGYGMPACAGMTSVMPRCIQHPGCKNKDLRGAERPRSYCSLGQPLGAPHALKQRQEKRNLNACGDIEASFRRLTPRRWHRPLETKDLTR